MPRKAVAKPVDRDSYIAEQVRKYQSRNAVLEGIVTKGEPIKTTSIGRTQWDPRTCSCGVKGRTDRDHAEDCMVEPVTDSSPVISAIKELRLNNAYLDSLMREIQPSDESPDVAEAMGYLRQVAGERDALRAEVAAVRSENARLRVALGSDVVLAEVVS